MKKALIRKLLAIAAAVVMLTSLAACGNQPQTDEPVNDSPAAVTSTDVSGSDVSATDVIDSAVDAAAADAVLEQYFIALNNGDAAEMVKLSAMPPILTYLEGYGLGEEYLISSYQATINGLSDSGKADYVVEYTYSGTFANDSEVSTMANEIEGLAAGTRANVQAVRNYIVIMKYSAIISPSDVLASDSDSSVLAEESTETMRLVKYDGEWYVYGN